MNGVIFDTSKSTSKTLNIHHSIESAVNQFKKSVRICAFFCVNLWEIFKVFQKKARAKPRLFAL